MKSKIGLLKVLSLFCFLILLLLGLSSFLNPVDNLHANPLIWILLAIFGFLGWLLPAET